MFLCTVSETWPVFHVHPSQKEIPTSIMQLKEVFKKSHSELICSPTEISLSYTVSHKQPVTAIGGTRALLFSITCSKQKRCAFRKPYVRLNLQDFGKKWRSFVAALLIRILYLKRTSVSCNSKSFFSFL